MFKRKEFRDILVEHLLPMFPGIKLGAYEKSTNRQITVAKAKGFTVLKVKPAAATKYRIPLSRSQPFESDEIDLVKKFVEEIEKVAYIEGGEYLSAILEAVPVRVIANHVGWMGVTEFVTSAIRHFESLASQTYEGRQIVSTLGITGSVNNGVVPCDKVWERDFARVLSNGFDTMILSNTDGEMFDFIALPVPESKSSVCAPQRMGAIANWAEKGRRRLALALNRNGEVLIFRKSSLAFAKRRGKWVYFPHSASIKGMGTLGPLEVREEVYKSCLDASFSRTGACICIVRKNNRNKVARLVDRKDVLVRAEEPKTKLLKKVIGKKFQAIDRRLRQELLAIDGATVMDHVGTVIAVGAIVKVPKGSKAGGGRRAAAIALSRIGLAIKVSSDGPVTGFVNGEPVFAIGGST